MTEEQNQENLFLRDLLYNSPSNIDNEDETILYYDIYGNGYSAKQINESKEKK